MTEEPILPKIEPERPALLFFQDVVSTLTEPRKFFTERYPQFTLTRALVFALVTSWLASFLEWMARMVRHETLMDGFIKIRGQLEALPIWGAITPHLFSDPTPTEMMPSWLMELASVALNPFKTLFEVAIGALVIYIGAYILVPKNSPMESGRDPVDYSSILKLFAIASTAPKLVGAILGFLPLSLGLVIGAIYIYCVEVLGLSIRYQVSKLRALGIIFLPSMVLLFVGACIIGAVGALLMGLVGSLFH